jgi:hypothetical protein
VADRLGRVAETQAALPLHYPRFNIIGRNPIMSITTLARAPQVEHRETTRANHNVIIKCPCCDELSALAIRWIPRRDWPAIGEAFESWRCMTTPEGVVVYRVL